MLKSEIGSRKSEAISRRNAETRREAPTSTINNRRSSFFKHCLPLSPLSSLASLLGRIACLLALSHSIAFGAGSTGSVTITGTAEVGQTLSAGNNLADADGLGAIPYQWYRDGQPIKTTLKDGLRRMWDAMENGKVTG